MTLAPVSATATTSAPETGFESPTIATTTDELNEITCSTDAPPNVTDENDTPPPSKSCPKIVTTVPTIPCDGLILSICGTATYPQAEARRISDPESQTIKISPTESALPLAATATI